MRRAVRSLPRPADRRIPPLVQLPRLLSAVERLADEKEDDEDLQLLLAPRSSLGGARPKASVRDQDGTLALAKFPHPQDEVDVVLWEAVALALAHRAGLGMPGWRIERIDGKPVLLIAGQVAGAISGWRAESAKWKVQAREVERMASAFEHDDLAAALELGRAASRTP